MGDAPAPVPRSGEPPLPPSAGVRPATSSLAVGSLILGILGFVTIVTAIPAIILGHLARRHIRRSGGLFKGWGIGTAGLVLGYLVMTLVTVLALVLPTFGQSSTKAPGTRDLAKAKQIALGVKLYAGDHDERTPPNLHALIPTYLSDDTLFESPLGPAGNRDGYDLLLPDTNLEALAHANTTVVLRGHYATRSGQRSYVYPDTHGEFRRDYEAGSHWYW